MSWRVDKDEAPTLFNRMRGNLLALAGSDRRAMRLRALLVDLQPPRVAAAEQSPDKRSPTQSEVKLPLVGSLDTVMSRLLGVTAQVDQQQDEAQCEPMCSPSGGLP